KIEGPQPYRPVTLSTFAIGKSLYNNNTAVEHFINVLLFALSGCVLFRLLNIWLKKYHIYILLCCVILFILHPIHTEVVANIKSRDEILALLFALLSIFFIHSYIKNGSKKYLFLSCIYFILSILSKENGITILAVIPLS